MDDFVFFKTWEIQLFNPYHKSRLTFKYSNNLSHEVDNCLEFHAIETMLTKFFVEHQVFRRFSVIFAHQGSRGIKTLFSRQALRRNCATARAGNVRAYGAASSTPGQVAGRQGGLGGCPSRGCWSRYLQIWNLWNLHEIAPSIFVFFVGGDVFFAAEWYHTLEMISSLGFEDCHKRCSTVLSIQQYHLNIGMSVS